MVTQRNEKANLLDSFIELLNGLKERSELQDWRIDTFSTKEPETIEWIHSFGGKGSSVFYDIGANVGLYSLFASFVGRGATEVYSFEPELRNFSLLARNILDSRVQNVFPFMLGCSSLNQLGHLENRSKRPGDSGAQWAPLTTSKPADLGLALSLSLDYLVEKLGFPPPTHVKIDVDGHESEILNGMRSLIRKKLPVTVLVEFNNGEELVNWSKFFEQNGYRIDHALDQVPGHSSIRRELSGMSARNVVFRLSP